MRVNAYEAWPEGYRAWKQPSDVPTASTSTSPTGWRAGEDPRRMSVVAAWRDAPWSSDAERAALALTESVTRLGDGRDVPDDVVDAVVEHHGDGGFAKLLLAIAVINGRNRSNVTTHLAPRA